MLEINKLLYLLAKYKAPIILDWYNGNTVSIMTERLYIDYQLNCKDIYVIERTTGKYLFSIYLKTNNLKYLIKYL
jgi:hypothetical protein